MLDRYIKRFFKIKTNLPKCCYAGWDRANDIGSRNGRSIGCLFVEWDSSGQSGGSEKVSQEREAICSVSRVPAKVDVGEGPTNEQRDDGAGLSRLGYELAELSGNELAELFGTSNRNSDDRKATSCYLHGNSTRKVQNRRGRWGKLKIMLEDI